MFKRKHALKNFAKFSLFLFFACAFFFTVYAQQTTTAKGTTELSYFYRNLPYCGAPPFVQNYHMPILNTFRIPSSVSEFYRQAGCGWGRIAVGYEVIFSQASTDYAILFLKNDNPVQTVPSYLTLAYDIAIDPPEGEDFGPGEGTGEEATPRRNEWISQGGPFDSPPVINVSKDFITKLCNAGQQKYWHSNYGKDSFCTVSGAPYTAGYTGQIKPFSTTKSTVSSIPSTYVAENGYTAYVIPFGGLKTAAYGGVQFFRAVDGSIQCKISCYGPLSKAIKQVYEIPIHKKTINGKEQYYIDLEEASKSCTNKPNVNPYVGCYDIGSAHFVYIDKIFFPDKMVGAETVQADLLIRLYNTVNKAPQLIFEMPLVMESGIPPEVSFDYEIESFTGEEVIVKFEPHASDPDGQIESLVWEFGDGKNHTSTTLEAITHSFVPGYYTVSLTAYDDDGLKAEKTRTLDLSLETLHKIQATTQ